MPRWLPLLALAACGPDPGSPVPSPPPPARPDLVLVTLDTTRADRLGAYGHAEAHTDWIDAKARAGTRFERAYAVQPLTIPSHASIMTGLWPWHHGVRSNGDATLDEAHQTLAELLAREGWQTAAAVGAFVTSRSWGFAQGFARYRDELATSGPDAWRQQRAADQVVDDAIALVQGSEAGRPLFLWVHLYDPHHPYTPPEAWRQRLPDRPYDGELAFVDDQLARLEAALAAAGRSPVWVLIGDHGEALGEHGELTHGLYVYDATQRVPWVISGPGVPAAVVPHPVSQVDLLPTVLALAGVEVPAGIDGLVQPGQPRDAWMESFQLTEQLGLAPHTAVVHDSRKLLIKPDPELYDLAADPDELQDLAAARPEEVAALRARAEALGPRLPTGRTQALDPEALARLQALGYVATTSFDIDFAGLPDPSDQRGLISDLLLAERASLEGRHAEAAAAMEQALAAQPDLAGLYPRASRVLLAAGQEDRALALLDQAVSRFPGDVDLLLRAAAAFGRHGQDERGLDLARRALQADPESERAAEYVVGALVNLGRRDEAAATAGAWLAEHPEADAAGLVALRGILLFEAGDLRAAEPLLRRAAAAPRPRAGVCQRLGALALAAGVRSDAEALLRREQELHGASPTTERLLRAASQPR